MQIWQAKKCKWPPICIKSLHMGDHETVQPWQYVCTKWTWTNLISVKSQKSLTIFFTWRWSAEEAKMKNCKHVCKNCFLNFVPMHSLHGFCNIWCWTKACIIFQFLNHNRKKPRDFMKMNTGDIIFLEFYSYLRSSLRKYVPGFCRVIKTRVGAVLGERQKLWEKQPQENISTTFFRILPNFQNFRFSILSALWRVHHVYLIMLTIIFQSFISVDTLEHF